ncbi:AAA family ATPase [Pseudidiomarina sp. 1APR75-33.1]|uniref:AAA family ATPase n=1 Tax=Pseudidiomarina terrestris TaxID=2820060 RepID=UPI002656C649|nr:AAA family ATPase [Pseudidiomarina sp. 1APR75-33.1]MDN7127040.1 AAA family ATPase [Pseudidiomarina sp. 1APR75-33.1]
MENVNKEIIEWVHTQPYWVQLATTKVFGQALVKDDLIDDLLDLLKTSEGQSKETKVDLAPYFNTPLGVHSDIRVLSIGEIEGIDALAPRCPLPFSQKLSVVYGSNGSGKSGYARILKKVCGKANATELQPNVFKTAPDRRQCTVTASVDGDEKTFVWQVNSSPVEELAPVDIFDSQTGLFYIDKEQDVSYLPNEVALFEQLVTVFQRLQQKLKAEKEQISTKLPARPNEYGDSKYVKGMFERLKHDTDVGTVEGFFKFSDDDVNSLKQLEERLTDSPVDLATKKTQRVNQLKGLLKHINNAAGAVSQVSINDLQQLEQDAQNKRRIAKQAADTIVNETSFNGFGNDTWKAMWEAARKYSDNNAYPEANYPVVEDGAKCVLCEQELDGSAKQRLVKFEDYVTGELESSATAAEKVLEKALAELPQLPNEQQLVTSLQAAQLDESQWLPIFRSIWDEIEKVTINEKDPDRESHKHYDLPPETFQGIQSLIDTLELQIEQHHRDAENFDKAALSLQINELKSKRWASAYIEAIKEEISCLQKKREIDEWLKSVNTTAISREAGRVSEILVTDAFVDRFNKELKLLGAAKVNVELVKTKTKHGRVQHKIQLNGLHPHYNRSKALNILSEGEQRIVSLAAFLADVTSKPNSAPFIFDDPISSLDQSYEEHTAKRLVSLSEERQVIVFTHRLSLLGQLIDQGDAECRHIRYEQWGSGEHSDLPLFAKKPINAVKDLKNARLSNARKVLAKDGYDAYYPLAKAICSDFRILLERIVERELLADVVVRHRRAVNTQGKIQNLAKIKVEDCDFIEVLMDDFSKFVHSQPDNSPVELPSPDEVEDALDTLINWHEEFKSRQV